MHRLRFNANEIKKVEKNRALLEDKLNIKITFEENDIIIKGEQYDEYLGKDVLEAISLGFSIRESLSLLKENNRLKIINLKEYVDDSSFNRIIGRIIGKQGKAKNNLEALIGVSISIHDKKIGVIGNYDDVELAVDAIMKIISGSPHSNVYHYIEKKIQQRRYNTGV